MKIMTLGKSPYLLTSHSKIHGLLLQHLYKSGHSVASVVSHHDTSYFVPEKDEKGRQVCYYKFENHKIPILPFRQDKEPAIAIYEILNVFKPDLLITVGDFTDCLFMKAVKMFCEHPFKWLAILANHSYPINEKNSELVESMDAILCTNKMTANMMQDLFHKDILEMCHFGGETGLAQKHKSNNKFRIMTSGKNAQVDNIPMLMEVVSELVEEIPCLELYVHSNIYDDGDYDLNLLKDRIDPKGKFIKFPNKYVSLTDGYSSEEYQAELKSSDLFVSISMTSGTGLSVFEAMSCGCLPLMSDVGCNREIADMITVFCTGMQRNEILVPCIDLITVGETYLRVCRPDALKQKIRHLYQKITKNAGCELGLAELIKINCQKKFWQTLDKMIVDGEYQKSSICVEVIRRK